jgi:hypothetical protein
MNYENIYARFIADRRAKEAVAVLGYYETHHIVPRSFGGSNEPDNLIRLTAEDHFFAHLLLARIYGGVMWSALFLMSGDRWGGRKHIKLRAAYGLARREWAIYAAQQPGLKGDANGMHDATRHEWVNIDSGEKRYATKSEMWAMYGGSRPHWTSVVSGTRKTFLGWFVGDEPKLRSNKNKDLFFINTDGREFYGTQKSFCEMSGVSIATASRITRRGAVSKCGWKLKGNERENHKQIKTRKGCGKTYTIRKDGVVFTGKAYECAQKIGSTTVQFHSGVYAISKTGTYKGWAINEHR